MRECLEILQRVMLNLTTNFKQKRQIDLYNEWQIMSLHVCVSL
jgi:hypothetical protein